MDASWKMMLNCDGDPYMLFNIKDDPLETTNLVSCPETAELILRSVQSRFHIRYC